MQENFHQPFADLNEETALRTILEGTATETGERFFKAPVEKLAKALRILTSRRHRDSCTSFFNPGSFERIYWLGHEDMRRIAEKLAGKRKTLRIISGRYRDDLMKRRGGFLTS
jgi:hypothetical protein